MIVQFIMVIIMTTTITPKLSYHKHKEWEVSHKGKDGLTNTNFEIQIKATMPNQI